MESGKNHSMHVPLARLSPATRADAATTPSKGGYGRKLSEKLTP